MSAGPEKYMFGLMDILEKKGHDVIVFSTVNSKNKKSKYSKYFVEAIGGKDKVYFEEYDKDLKTSSQVLERQFYSKRVKNKLTELIKDTKPNVALLLHHQNKLSPSVIDTCHENNVPIVMRLSDFSLVCSRNNLLRNGNICEACIEKDPMQGVKYKCVKNSYMGSLVKALALKYYRATKIYDKVDKIIIPSKHTLDKVKFLFDDKKLVHLPSFIINGQKYSSKAGDYALFVGRVEEEKGLIYAIKAFQNTSYELKIVGHSHSGYDKILKKYVKENNIKNIKFLGAKFGKDLETLYKNARFVILPNIWYENMPNVALEAMLFSKPILTTNLGSMKEIVKHNHNGLLFKLKDVDDLKNKVETLFNNAKLCKKLGKSAYDDTTTKYSPEKHYEKLIELFEKTIK